MKSVLSNPILEKYILSTDNDGVLFIRNNITPGSNINSIINTLSKKFEIDESNQVEFNVP